MAHTRVNTERYELRTMFCTVHCNIITQHKPALEVEECEIK